MSQQDDSRTSSQQAMHAGEDAPKVAPASRKNHHAFAPFSMKPAKMAL
jgi:hypothetical protein